MKTWNLKNDIIVTDAEPLFSLQEAKKIEIGVFCVNTQNGIFYQKQRRDTYDLIQISASGKTTIMKNTFVFAVFSNKKTTRLLSSGFFVVFQILQMICKVYCQVHNNC